MSALGASTGCYLCKKRAARSCTRCRRWFCEHHGGLLLGNRCRTCDYDARMGATVMAMVAVVALMWWIFTR